MDMVPVEAHCEQPDRNSTSPFWTCSNSKKRGLIIYFLLYEVLFAAQRREGENSGRPLQSVDFRAILGKGTYKPYLKAVEFFLEGFAAFLRYHFALLPVWFHLNLGKITSYSMSSVPKSPLDLLSYIPRVNLYTTLS